MPFLADVQHLNIRTMFKVLAIDEVSLIIHDFSPLREKLIHLLDLTETRQAGGLYLSPSPGSDEGNMTSFIVS